MVREIAWSHNVLIMERCRDVQQREFYLRMAAKFGWTKNVLALRIQDQTYEKTLLGQGLKGIDIIGSVSDHYVAACAAALAAWKWHLDQSAWIFKSEMPYHPYDFAC